MKKGPNLRWSLIQCSGGDEGDRTPDLLTASQALSQLSYAPVRRSTIRELGRRCKDNFGKLSAAAMLPSRAIGPPPSRRSHYQVRPRTALTPRPKRGPVYYDDSGTADHAPAFADVASALPAVLQTVNAVCSRDVDLS